MSVPTAEIEQYRPWSHRAALMVACATFPLIWVGGLVTTYDAGMAVPDWPSTFGYNLFLYPWQSWLAGPWDLFIEHGHRQIGALVGLLAIFLVVTTWGDSRRWLRVLSIVALLMVIVQGLLGGQRVLLDDRRIAQLHGCVGPLFFAFAAMLTTFTSRWWTKPTTGAPVDDNRRSVRNLRRLSIAAWIAFGLAVGQLVLGSQLRHGVEYSSAAVFRSAVVFHIVFACGLALQVFVLGIKSMRARVGGRIGLMLIALVACQLALGVGTWAVKYGWPTLLADVFPLPAFTVQAESMWQSLTVTAHVAMGSLILALTGTLAVRLMRLQHVVGVPASAAVDGRRPSVSDGRLKPVHQRVGASA